MSRATTSEDAPAQRSRAARSAAIVTTAFTSPAPRRRRGRRPRAWSGAPGRRRSARPPRRARRQARHVVARRASNTRVPAAVSTSTPRGRASSSGAPCRDDPAVEQDDDAVADELDLAEQVGVEEHRDAAPAQLLEQLAHDAAADRVERARRLVEQEQARRADQRLRDPEPLLHALRHLIDPARRARPPSPTSSSSSARSARAAGRAGQPLVQGEHLVGGAPAGEAEELGEVAERGARASREPARRAADLRRARRSGARARRRS